MDQSNTGFWIGGAAVCGPGRIREQNQDNFYLNGIYREDPCATEIRCERGHYFDRGFFAVADGMGGEKFGELASCIAVRSLDVLLKPHGNEDVSRYLLERNEEICALIREKGVRSGTTFVSIDIQDSRVDVTNVGDSRAYLLREGRLRQISKDHTAIRQMVELGVVTPEQAATHPDRHKLTQHLGIFPEELVIEPYTVTGSLRDGDLFLLCSDGLYDMVEDSVLESALKETGTLDQKATHLFDLAMQAGGRDNITVLLILAREVSA